MEAGLSEPRQSRRPNVPSTHSPVLLCIATLPRELFPAEIEAFVHITAVLWVSVFAEQSGVPLEVPGLVYVKFSFGLEWKGEETFASSNGIVNRRLRDGVVLYCAVWDLGEHMIVCAPIGHAP